MNPKTQRMLMVLAIVVILAVVVSLAPW